MKKLKKFGLLLLTILVIISAGGFIRPENNEEQTKRIFAKIEFFAKMESLNMQLPDMDYFFDVIYPLLDNGMDMNLAIAQMYVESRGHVNAVGRAREKGLYQFMRATAIDTAKSLGWNYVDGMEFDQNISVTLYYWHMQDLLEHYSGNTQLALLAYNCGSGAIDYWLSTGKNARQIKKIIYDRRGWKAYDDKVGEVYAQLTNKA